MPSNNFLIFDENQQNMMGDGDYSVSTRRLNGVQTGIASSQLQNKTLFQTSVIARAVADLMNAYGFDATDNDADFSAKLQQLFSSVGGWTLYQSYTSSGSYTFTTPSDINELGVFIVGGGAGGGIGIGTASPSVCGPSGETLSVIIQNPLASYSVVVGAGGAGYSYDGSTSSHRYYVGSNGNSSAFGSFTANGGYISDNLSLGDIVLTGGTVNVRTNDYETDFLGKGYVTSRIASSASRNGYFTSNPLMAVNPFDNKRLLFAGAFPATGYTKISDTQYTSTAVQRTVTDDYGNYSSEPAYTVYYQNVQGSYDALPASATVGTSYGCGGSPAYMEDPYGFSSTRQFKLDGASGCSGAVLIYTR